MCDKNDKVQYIKQDKYLSYLFRQKCKGKECLYFRYYNHSVICFLTGTLWTSCVIFRFQLNYRIYMTF